MTHTTWCRVCRPLLGLSVQPEHLKLGTRDAAMHYHAGMIHLATGEKAKARAALELALEINPRFDPLQAERAAEALRDLK